MKLPTKFSVSRSIAERCGVYSGRYVTADGRSLVDSHDLKSLHLEAEEYVNGIDARIITDEEFRVLRDNGGNRLGMDVLADETTVVSIDEETEDDGQDIEVEQNNEDGKEDEE